MSSAVSTGCASVDKKNAERITELSAIKAAARKAGRSIFRMENEASLVMPIAVLIGYMPAGVEATVDERNRVLLLDMSPWPICLSGYDQRK